MGGLNDVSVALVSMPRAPDCGCSTFNCLPSFFGGILVLALVEIVCAFYFISRLLTRKERHPSSTSSLEYRSEAGSISFSLQGNLWVAPLPEGDWSKAVLLKPGKDKKKEKDAEKDGSKEGSKRGETTKDALEIAPMWRHVVLKEGVLLLKAADDIEERISLEGCEVTSVSAGTSAGGKWAKRFPIKLHHPTRILYRECQDCLFYAESGYEKEAWCEVLRATARANDSANDWCLRLKKEFRDYTIEAEKHVPYLTRFHSTKEANHFVAALTEEKSDDHKKSDDEGVSKKRQFLNKLLRRNSKGKEPKDATRSPNAIEELGNFTRRIKETQDEGSSRKGKGAISDDHEDSKSASRASHVSNESISRSESSSSDSEGEKAALVTQKDNSESDEVLAAPLMQGHGNDRVEKEIDQGVLCLNMVVARLFFDFYHSESRVAWLQHQFQRLISRIKTPNYIKSITIKELDLGKDPPFATALRMLPADAAGALALEVDLEWYGGGFITIETRVDVRDQNAQEKVASQLADPGSAGAAAAAIVSGIGEDLETAGSPDVSSTAMVARQAAVTKKPGSGDDSSRRGRWMNSVKSMMSRVAEQVAQVPLLLKIRLVSVKGTCIVSLRAPPSDRVWFSFKEMPDIDLAPEPCIRDHRISSGPLGNYIASQIKVQIREQIVLPYFQDLFLHWMMAEQNDWLPQSALPVAFSAVTISEKERQTSKHNPDAQSKPLEEHDENGQPLPSRTPSVHNNGQNQPLTRQISEASSYSVGLGSTSPISPHTQNSSHGPPTTQVQPPTTHAPGGVQASGSNRSLSRFSASSEQSSSGHLFPARPPGATVQSSAPSSIREDPESDLTRPLLDTEAYSMDKLLRSSSGFDSGASDRATAKPFDRDLLQYSESSASESESHNPSNQVPNQDNAKADLLKDLDSNPSSRRAKMLSLGKKVGTKLDERRRIVLEKLQEKRAKGAEGGSSRHG